MSPKVDVPLFGSSQVPCVEVEFRRMYRKLQLPFFNTIRRGSKGLSEGEMVVVRSPLESFRAVVTFVKEVALSEIPSSTLCWDTDTFCREDALEHLQLYYPYLTMNSTVYLIGFRKVQ